jgi:uncharacterized membrane protein YfbV (UPF0208 family)
MKLSVVQLIKLGQKYLSSWPNKPELSHYFADYKTVQVARLICRYFPALALFTFTMQLYIASGYPMGQGSTEKVMNALPQALVYAIFLLSIPIHALVMSGVKADTLLPPSLESWYRSGLEKAKQQGKSNSSSHSYNNTNKNSSDSENTINKLAVYKPRYIDLARLLQLNFTARN